MTKYLGVDRGVYVNVHCLIVPSVVPNFISNCYIQKF